MAAAPIAWKVRKTMIQATCGESAHPSEARLKSATPIRNSPLWPKRSARRPIVMKRTVRTRL